MSVKRLLILAAAGIATLSASAAFAGGPDNVAMPAMPAFQPSYYVDANVGVQNSNWDMASKHLYGPYDRGTAFPSTNTFIFGGDLGYQYSRHWAVELGGYFAPKKLSGKNSSSDTVTVRTHFYYVGIKPSVDLGLIDNVKLFGKFGIARKGLKYAGATTAARGAWNGFTSYWTPIFALGAEYAVNHDWSANFQYMFVPGYFKGQTANSAPVKDALGNEQAQNPNSHIFTVGAGYHFSM